MVGQVGNNKSKADFINRVGNFSTHGSRKGFVDVNVEITSDQLLDLKELRELLGQKKLAWSQEMAAIRQELRENGRHQLSKPLKHYEHIAKQGRFNNSRKDSQKLLNAIVLSERLQELEKEILIVNDQLKQQNISKGIFMIKCDCCGHEMEVRK